MTLAVNVANNDKNTLMSDVSVDALSIYLHTTHSTALSAKVLSHVSVVRLSCVFSFLFSVNLLFFFYC